MTQLPDALAALARGWSIFPVEPGAKTPIRIHQDKTPEEAPWTVRWSEIATNDINTIVKWWTYAPNANIGVACKPSGLFVVDCDQPKRDGQLSGTHWAYLHALLGPRVDGETLFDQVTERYAGAAGLATIFDTYTVNTGSGGKHFYYTWPDGVQSTQDSIHKGLLDVRGNGGDKGGYVLGAGSVTDAGPYVSGNSKSRVRAAPPWLVALCRERPAPVRSSATYKPVGGPSNFSGLATQVATAQQGNRNNILLWAARAMCADGATEEQCAELLVPAAMQAGCDGGERQAHQTIRSAYRLQNRKLAPP